MNEIHRILVTSTQINSNSALSSIANASNLSQRDRERVRERAIKGACQPDNGWKDELSSLLDVAKSSSI